MHLVDTSDKLDIALGGAVAANQVQFTATWSDITSTGFTAGHSDGQTNGATVVDLVAVPGSSTYRVVRELSIYNKDTANVTVTVRFDNGTTQRELVVALLVPGNSLLWTSENGWQLGNTNAATDATPGELRVATDAEMDAGTSVLVAVTPGKMHLHPAVAKVWCDCAGSGSSINTSYNVTALSDQATGRCGINFTRGFANRNFAAIMSQEYGQTTYAVTAAEDGNIRSTSISPGHVELESYDHTATTMAYDDPASYYFVAFGDMVQ